MAERPRHSSFLDLPDVLGCARLVLTAVADPKDLIFPDSWTYFAQALRTIELEENRLRFEPEVNAKIPKARWQIYQVPVSYCGRTYADEKKFYWKDSRRALYCTIKHNVFSRLNTQPH